MLGGGTFASATKTAAAYASITERKNAGRQHLSFLGLPISGCCRNRRCDSRMHRGGN